MAFQTRGRDPLFDSNMQAAIERRGKELGGLALIALGLMAAIMIGSYDPNDPSWMSATDAPVQNWLGQIGASIAAPVFMIVGWGSWGISALLLGWGLRLALHRGEERALSRLIFSPIWVALLAVYAASLVPGPGWTHNFGMGGLFGDTVLATVLGVAPIAASLGLKLLSLMLGAGMVALGIFVLGFTGEELRRIARFLLVGVILLYANLLKLLGHGAVGAVKSAQTLQQKGVERRARRAAAAEERRLWAEQAAEDEEYAVYEDYEEPVPAPAPAPRRSAPVVRRAVPVPPEAPAYEAPVYHGQEAAYEPYAEPEEYVLDAAPEEEEAPRGGFLSRLPLPGLKRRSTEDEMPEPEWVDPAYPGAAEGQMSDDMTGDDRIKAKIADIVRSRARRVAGHTAPANMPLTKGRGRRPGPLIVSERSQPSRVEPPLTAAPVALPPEPPLTASRAAPPAPAAPVETPTLRAEPRMAAPQAPAAERPAAPAPAPAAAPSPRAVAPQPRQPVAPSAPVEEAPMTYAEVEQSFDAGYDEAAIGTEWDDYDETVEAFWDGVPHEMPEPAPRRVEPSMARVSPRADAPRDEIAGETRGDAAAITPRADAYDDEGPMVAPRADAPRPVIPTGEPARRVVHSATMKASKPSARAEAEANPKLQFEEPAIEYELPPLNLLANPANIQRHVLSDEALEENARMLENVLDDYGVKGEIVSVRPGPVVTMYELEPAPGLKASRVIGLADDIARSMSALSARVSTVPGRSVIGIELPNENREKVVLREILASRDFDDKNMKLPLALGKDIGGGAVVANLAKMPHLLIAGTTGSGKSVAINTMILSLLYRLTPDECRLIMIDPKMLELSVYDGIPHLLSPVVTDPKKAVVALKWVVGEMEERYRKMSKMGVRNIDGYNGRVQDALAKGEMFSRTVQTGFDDETGDPVFETEEIRPEKMPYIVVIVDEMADLMMVAGKEIEACIQRLAQMARASGIHLIMATQRPSVDVITGTIKANFPTRISFQVTSKIDSRTILGEMGAEQLLGMGDMLYMAGGARITRCHGPFVSDEEVEEIVNHLKAYGPPSYIGGVVEGPDEEKADDIDAVLGLSTGGNTDGEDALYDQAVAVVIKDRKCSTSYIQRKLAIGYNKAARLVEQMEEEGLVSPANHVGKREILVPEQ